MIKYQQGIERLQAARKRQERIDEGKSDEEIERDRCDPASFVQASKDPDAYRLLSYLPPPKGWKKPLPEAGNGKVPLEKEGSGTEKQAA